MYDDQNDTKGNRSGFLKISFVIGFAFLILFLVEARKYFPTLGIVWKASEVEQARLKKQNKEVNEKTLREVRCQGLYHPSGTEFILEQGYLATVMTGEQQFALFNPYQVKTFSITDFKSCLTFKVEINDFKTARKFRETLGMEIVNEDGGKSIVWNNSGNANIVLTTDGRFFPIINQGRIPVTTQKEKDQITNGKILTFPGMRF